MIKFVCWKDGNMWLGYLEEYPDGMTQGITFEELKENLRSGNDPGLLRAMMIALVFTLALSLFLGTDMVLAKGNDDDNRSEFYGIIQMRPEKGLQGTWVIGNRAFTADAGTEFDQSEGQLTVGSCAKVHVREGRVHEIDSEPMRNCQIKS